MRRSLAILRFVAFGLACVVLAVVIALWTIERTGMLRDIVQRELAARLGDAGRSLSIADARLDWFETGLHLERVELGARGALVRLEELDARFDLLGEEGLRLVAVSASGGRIAVGPELIGVARAFRAASVPTESAPARRRAPFPSCSVRGIQIDLDALEVGEVPLGLVDARAGATANGRVAVVGRIAPSFCAPGNAREIDFDGNESADGVFELHAAADGVAFDSSALPGTPAFAALRACAPSGSLALDAHTTVDLAHPGPTRGVLRAALKSGAMQIASGAPALYDAAIEVEAHLEPREGETWGDVAAWRGAISFRSKLGDAEISGFGALGRDSGTASRARGFVHAHGAPLEESTLLALGVRGPLLEAFEVYGLHGQADLHAGFDWRANGELPLALEVESRGLARMSFEGWRGDDGQRHGFPWPVEHVRGRAIAIYDPARSRPTELALIGLSADGAAPGAEAARAHCDGFIRSPSTPARLPELDLRIAASGVPVDEHLRSAVNSILGSDWVWRMFSPQNGSGEASVRLQQFEHEGRMAAFVDGRVTDVDAAWSEIPIPFSHLHGDLKFVFDPRHVGAVAFALSGGAASADSATIRGRWQDDPGQIERARDERTIEDLSVALDNVALKGAQRDILVDRFPSVGTALEAFGAAGKSDVAFRMTRALPWGHRTFDCELTPRVVQLAPKAFQVVARNVRGRVVIDGVETPPSTPTGSPGAELTTHVAPLVGDWSNDTRVALSALFPPSGVSTLELAGSGLSLQNRALVGAFRQAFAGSPGQGGLDLAALSIDGRIDFRGQLSFQEGSAVESRYEVRLRENRIQAAGGMSFGLDALSGTLVQHNGELSGENLHARLGTTDVLLQRARAYDDHGRFHLEAAPEVRGLPLDREHTRFFLDAATLDALDRFGWKGTIDIVDSKLDVVGTSASDARVVFSGSLAPEKLEINVGVPISIAGAKVRLRNLSFEQGQVRAWAEITDLDGEIAGRKLDQAKMLLTYIEPHLSILDLSGKLEGGAIADLGSAAHSGGPAFSVDLRPPYAFDLGLELQSVDVSGLVRGLFESDFASSGKLTGDLRLSGNLDHLSGIQGRGNIDLTDSRLWSVPVVRDLFAQLGYDKPAVFQRVKSRFEIEHGVVAMKSLYVASPLVQLVGSGELDLDGRLHHDLEVKYSLVDKLGPFTRFLYWIQNNLLRVEVRGDMSRPKILLRGALSFLQRHKSEKRDLPLPPFTPIPERF